MKILYKNTNTERVVMVANAVTAAVVIATLVLLHGFDAPLVSVKGLHIVQIMCLLIFLAEKTIRLLNAVSKKEYIRANWFEVPLLLGLMVFVFGAGHFSASNPGGARILALSIYLVVQVVARACEGCVNIAASGRNPAKALITVFLILIISGASLLMLPRSYNCDEMSFVDALFTATSATCVTGLIVKDTGNDFSFMGQLVILTLIQLGGLGIVIFGAVLALLLRQVLSVRESVAMQDMLNAKTLGRIGNMIGFIFIATILIEAVGVVFLFRTFSGAADGAQAPTAPLFYSIFHSISAFCNAGFSLFNTSLIEYNGTWGVYGVIMPLIILGGLGFGVLYNIADVAADRLKRLARSRRHQPKTFEMTTPRRISLQSKMVLVTSLILILSGMVVILIMEGNVPPSDQATAANTEASGAAEKVLGALFQSVTARTAGFNTVDISSMSPASKLVLMTLMLIGGSPGSTAGGIKTVTLAVIIMVAYATFRKRQRVEVFKRSVSNAVVGRAIAVTLLFAAVLIFAVLALSLTERENAAEMGDIAFEAASALGTVGLSTGITGSLTTAGKLIIIVVMLIGRLGPLTLLAAITFNIKPAGYSYPDEPIIVG